MSKDYFIGRYVPSKEIASDLKTPSDWAFYILNEERQSGISENNFYKLKASVDNNAGTFEFEATAESGPPLKDTECTKLIITDTGLKKSEGSADSSTCWGK